MKKIAVTVATLLALGATVAVAPSADASSWGCGGRPCRVAR